MQTSPSRRRIVPLLLALWLGWTAAAALGVAPQQAERTLAVSLGAADQPLRGREILLFDGASSGPRTARTDAQGRIRLPSGDAGEQMSALYLLEEQPDARHPDEWAVRTYARGGLRAGRLVLDPQQTITTFDVTVSLEWQPGNKEQELANLAGCGAAPAASTIYLEDVAAAMQAAAAYLYDLTDGQMTFGKVTVYTGGEQWQAADIRILASNDYRPTALIGGIVDAPTPLPNADGSLSLTFRPGQIFLGRLWDGETGRCGPWSASAGARTIVHEWLHYALNLWDEYHQPASGGATYCAADDLPLFAPGSNVASAMAYHYTANALWRGNVAGGRPAPPSCIDTDQMLVHHRSDWETIKVYFPTLTMPDPVRGPLPGPSFGGTVAVTQGSAAASEATTSALVKLTAPISPELKPQSYLFIPREGASPAPLPIPRRIIGQGALWPAGSATFWGAGGNSSARVLLADPTTNTRFFGPIDDRAATALTVGGSNSLDLKQADPAANIGWRPQLQLVPILGQSGDVVALRVLFEDCDRNAKRVQMVYCPAGGDCGDPVFVSVGVGGVFEQVLTAPDGGLLPFYGYVYVRDPERGAWTATWYQLGGGVGPAHADGHVPMVDGVVATSIPTGTLQKGEGTATLVMPAQRCEVIRLPQGQRGLLSYPLEVQLVRGERPWTPNDPPVSIRLSYDQDLAARLGVRASDLSLLAFDAISSPRIEWEEVPVAGRDGRLGWLSADVAKQSGGLRPIQGSLLLAVSYRTASGPEQNERLLLPAVRK